MQSSRKRTLPIEFIDLTTSKHPKTDAQSSVKTFDYTFIPNEMMSGEVEIGLYLKRIHELINEVKTVQTSPSQETLKKILAGHEGLTDFLGNHFSKYEIRNQEIIESQFQRYLNRLYKFKQIIEKQLESHSGKHSNADLIIVPIQPLAQPTALGVDQQRLQRQSVQQPHQGKLPQRVQQSLQQRVQPHLQRQYQLAPGQPVLPQQYAETHLQPQVVPQQRVQPHLQHQYQAAPGQLQLPQQYAETHLQPQGVPQQVQSPLQPQYQLAPGQLQLPQQYVQPHLPTPSQQAVPQQVQSPLQPQYQVAPVQPVLPQQYVQPHLPTPSQQAVPQQVQSPLQPQYQVAPVQPVLPQQYSETHLQPQGVPQQVQSPLQPQYQVAPGQPVLPQQYPQTHLQTQSQQVVPQQVQSPLQPQYQVAPVQPVQQYPQTHLQTQSQQVAPQQRVQPHLQQHQVYVAPQQQFAPQPQSVQYQQLAHQQRAELTGKQQLIAQQQQEIAQQQALIQQQLQLNKLQLDIQKQKEQLAQQQALLQGMQLPVRETTSQLPPSREGFFQPTFFQRAPAPQLTQTMLRPTTSSNSLQNSGSKLRIESPSPYSPFSFPESPRPLSLSSHTSPSIVSDAPAFSTRSRAKLSATQPHYDETDIALPLPPVSEEDFITSFENTNDESLPQGDDFFSAVLRQDSEISRKNRH